MGEESLMRPLATWMTLITLGLAAAGCATAGGATGHPEAHGEEGLASFYAPAYDGQRTASGERFDSQALTAAHRTLPFGTRARVTNLENRRTVVVRINDRGPFKKGRVIDVSKRAARELGFLGQGTARVRVELVDR